MTTYTPIARDVRQTAFIRSSEVWRTVSPAGSACGALEDTAGQKAARALTWPGQTH